MSVKCGEYYSLSLLARIQANELQGVGLYIGGHGHYVHVVFSVDDEGFAAHAACRGNLEGNRLSCDVGQHDGSMPLAIGGCCGP